MWNARHKILIQKKEMQARKRIGLKVILAIRNLLCKWAWRAFIGAWWKHWSFFKEKMKEQGTAFHMPVSWGLLVPKKAEQGTKRKPVIFSKCSEEFRSESSRIEPDMMCLTCISQISYLGGTITETSTQVRTSVIVDQHIESDKTRQKQKSVERDV